MNTELATITKEDLKRDTHSGKGRSFGGLTPAEASRRGVQARRKNAAERAAGRISERDKIGSALGRLSQKDWDDVVSGIAAEAKAGKATAIRALVALVEQHLGKIGPSDAATPDDETLTHEEWAMLKQALIDVRPMGVNE